MIEQIQENLKQEGVSPLDSRVADMTFAFNNREMLKLLKQRYEYLCHAKFDKAEAIESKLTYMKNE